MEKKGLLILGAIALVVVVGVIAAVYLKPYVRDRPKGVVRTAVQEGMDREAADVYKETERIALEETAAFVIEHMPKVPAFTEKSALLDHSLGLVDPQLAGLYCEFGVATGGSINHIASKTEHTIHGFDSFEGLPETWRTGLEKGAFKTSGLPDVRQNVELYKGWFDKSLPVWAEAHPGPMAFMHVDCDLYSSTKTVFDVLGDRVVPGTIIQLDDYFNYPGWQQGEHKAFEEFVESRQLTFEYLGYYRHGAAIAVRILTVGSPPAPPDAE
jgi:hypothetical protein